MPGSPETRFVYEPSAAEKIKYKGRTIRPERFLFRNQVLEDLLFTCADSRLENAGICSQARDRWTLMIVRREVPDVDCFNQPKVFIDFQDFEKYLEDVYRTACENKQIRPLSKK